VKLLIESLPEGAKIAGDAEVTATLARDALAADVSFVVAVEKRPEIRRVFPPRGGLTAAAPSSSSRGTTTIERRSGASPRGTGPAASALAAGTARYAIQVAALSDPQRASELVSALKSGGMPAYLVAPPPTDPGAPYRVRVGPYQSATTAQRTAAALEKKRGEKLWVTREVLKSPIPNP
jgi:cell division septation protein DedD